jgi:hypothetical protein
LNLRRILPYTTFALILAAAYTGWTFYSRYSAGQEASEKAREKEAQQDQNTVDRFGGGKLRILSFYASPHLVSSGQRVLVCYSVVNATEVSITPEIEPIKPSITRCLEVFPKETTTFTLKARDAAGAEATQKASVVVR